MNCPYCSAPDTKVIDSRHLTDANSTKRRRKCASCEKRFTSYETIQIIMPMVEKSDGRREPFKREKILDGVSKACQKRPIATAQIDHIVDSIEKSLMEINDKEISTREIGSMVMDYLRVLDPVAYVRFASVYKTFKDVDEFVKNLSSDDQNSLAPRN